MTTTEPQRHREKEDICKHETKLIIGVAIAPILVDGIVRRVL